MKVLCCPAFLFLLPGFLRCCGPAEDTFSDVAARLAGMG
jgi:hypothetical protein